MLCAQARAQRGTHPPAESAHRFRFVLQRAYGCQTRPPHCCVQGHSRCAWRTPFTDACGGGVFSLHVCSTGRSGWRVRLLSVARISAYGRRLRAHQSSLLLGQATPMMHCCVGVVLCYVVLCWCYVVLCWCYVVLCWTQLCWCADRPVH